MEAPKSDNLDKLQKYKMTFVLSLCVAYCLAMTVSLGVYAFNTRAFTGYNDGSTCFADSNTNSPVLSGTNVSS